MTINHTTAQQLWWHIMAPLCAVGCFLRNADSQLSLPHKTKQKVNKKLNKIRSGYVYAES